MLCPPNSFATAIPASQTIAITVQDDGPGIPPEIMQKVFEPFFSTHSEEGLRGLGLSIVQDIVKIHGGRIEIKSEPSSGTRITLYFPMVSAISGI